MTVQVIETKRSLVREGKPAVRGKLRRPDVRAKAEVLASEMGGSEIKPKPAPSGVRPTPKRRER